MEQYFCAFRSYILILVIIFLTRCSDPRQTTVERFSPIVNTEFKGSDSEIGVTADLENAVLNGIEIPSERQAKGGIFLFEFQLKDPVKAKYFYKIYYQNVSYAFHDTNSLSSENFYGSWENTG